MVKKEMKKNVYSFYLSLCPDKEHFIRKAFAKEKVYIHCAALTSENMHTDTEILGVFVDSKLDNKMLDAMPNLKLIVTLSVGFDHIDLEYAKKKKITVCNIPNYGENTVAEHALALLLSIAREIPDSVNRVRSGIFSYEELRGFDLLGKTVGVVGTGRIGTYFIKLLQGFGVNILAYDPFPRKELMSEYNFKYVKLEKLLHESDIISLHVPLTKDTKHLINKKTLSQMKKGVVIINSSRGGIVDGKALLAGLEKGKVFAAGLDVLEGEEYLKHPQDIHDAKEQKRREEFIDTIHHLTSHPQIIVTPHNAFNSNESIERMFQLGVDTIKRFNQKKALKNKLV